MPAEAATRSRRRRITRLRREASRAEEPPPRFSGVSHGAGHDRKLWLYAGPASALPVAGCVAQLVEQLTLNQRVHSSILCTPTKFSQVRAASHRPSP